ncbi:MAG TPA: EthD domain-containing protein [Candidatus Binataceae bacterium]|nr:EthD domain-containing protein [Candidatus Binataceae bacterium]
MIKLVYVVHRRADVSEADFHKYWLEKHGPLVRSFAKAIRAAKYVQSHTMVPMEEARQNAQRRGMGEPCDGITEVWWNSPEDLAAGSATPEGQAASRALLEDEARFIDLKRSTIFMTEEHTIFDYTGGAR